LWLWHLCKGAELPGDAAEGVDLLDHSAGEALELLLRARDAGEGRCRGIPLGRVTVCAQPVY